VRETKRVQQRKLLWKGKVRPPCGVSRHEEMRLLMAFSRIRFHRFFLSDVFSQRSMNGKAEEGVMSDGPTQEDVEDPWFEEDATRTLAHVYATLFLAGYQKAKHGRPGCRVLYYTGLIFVDVDDPANTCDHQTRRETVKKYQEVLARKGIHLEFFDDPSAGPYLCG
jgi:hypothetical protein